MSNTELAGVGLQDVGEDRVESDLDIGLKKVDISIGVMGWSQVQLHERTTIDFSAGRGGQGGEVSDE